MILFQLSFGRKKRKLLHVLWVWERQCGKLDLFRYRNLLLSWITSSLPRTWEGDACPQAEEGSWCPGFSTPASLVPLEDSWAFPCTPTPFQKVPSNSTLKPLEETSPPRHPVWSILRVYRAIDIVGENVRNLQAGKGREVRDNVPSCILEIRILIVVFLCAHQKKNMKWFSPLLFDKLHLIPDFSV